MEPKTMGIKDSLHYFLQLPTPICHTWEASKTDQALTYAMTPDWSMNLIMKRYRRRKSPMGVSAISSAEGLRGAKEVEDEVTEMFSLANAGYESKPAETGGTAEDGRGTTIFEAFVTVAMGIDGGATGGGAPGGAGRLTGGVLGGDSSGARWGAMGRADETLPSAMALGDLGSTACDV